MSSNIYMKIETEEGKEIEGNSTAKGHEKWIELMSWSHGFHQPTTAATKSSDQQATSRANHSDLSCTKFTDASSSPLMHICWTGKQIDKITIECYRASGSDDVGGGSTDYLTILMEDVIIGNFSISGGGDELPIENITFNYTKITYTFKPVTFETGAGGDPIPISHDLSTNEVE